MRVGSAGDALVETREPPVQALHRADARSLAVKTNPSPSELNAMGYLRFAAFSISRASRPRCCPIRSISQSRSEMAISRTSSMVTLKPEPPCCRQHTWNRPSRQASSSIIRKELLPGPGASPLAGLARHEEGPLEREVDLLGGEALGALDLDGRVHAAVHSVELVDQEVGVAHGQLLDELAPLARLNALDLAHAEGEHGRQQLVAGAASELGRRRSSAPVSRRNQTRLPESGQYGLEPIAVE
jgi:hypothetical protein